MVKFVVEKTLQCEGLQNVLGSGAHGKVVECNLKKNNQFVLKESNQETLDGEYEYIDYRGKTSAVKYKYVARMFPVITDKFTYDKTKVVMEKVTSDLDQMIETKQELKKKRPNAIGYDYSEYIAWAESVIFKLKEMIDFFYTKVGYAHNDIKPANIGYKETPKGKELKLIDMGSSTPVKKGVYDMPSDSRLHGYTLQYISPQVLNTNKQDDYNRDRWAIGCTMYELIAFDKMIHPLNDKIFSAMTILMNFDIGFLNYMLGYNDDEKYKNKIPYNMKVARTMFTGMIQKYPRSNEIRKMMLDMMSPSVIQEDKPKLRINNFVLGAGTSDIEETVSFVKQNNGDIEILNFKNFNAFRQTILTMKGANLEEMIKSKGGKSNLLSRRKITEKQYTRAKATGNKHVRVAKYKLKDGNFVYYKYA